VSFDFSLSPCVEEWRDRIRRFVDEVVIPREQDAFISGADDTLRKELQQAGKAAGLWAPQAPAELGGGGFAFDEAAVLLEEAGRSLLGPLALGCSAPDEGNCGIGDVGRGLGRLRAYCHGQRHGVGGPVGLGAVRQEEPHNRQGGQRLRQETRHSRRLACL
jgi:alkylation response protein AidB-like acyl-CoA dehydrogenase